MIDTKKIKNKHGFTLVEIIVVLVILAILAAVAIPSVLGYVDEAKKAGIIQEAHGIYEAAQIAATKCYATDEDEFKKQSIFKYNYTLPADFPYKKTTTNPVGRVSDSLMSYGQKEPDKYLSDSYSGASYIDKEIVKNVKHNVIAEGNINTPEKVKRVMQLGVFSIVVGSAITRPQLITKAFVDALKYGRRHYESIHMRRYRRNLH